MTTSVCLGWREKGEREGRREKGNWAELDEQRTRNRMNHGEENKGEEIES